MAERIRCGMLGTGHAHAIAKLEVLKKSEDYELVGVHEPDEELRRKSQAHKSFQGVR